LKSISYFFIPLDGSKFCVAHETVWRDIVTMGCRRSIHPWIWRNVSGHWLWICP